MKTVHDIIRKPIITEASMAMGGSRKYAFEVMKDATKPEIAAAVEELFKVEVKKVNTINVRGQLRRYGRFEGYNRSWKKAIVTLTDASKTIEFFDGMM